MPAAASGLGDALGLAQDTMHMHIALLTEGTARAAQLAPSAVTAGAVGADSEDLPPEVWLAESLRRRGAPPTRRASISCVP